MAPATIPEWAREPHSWQQIHINSPEDELRVPFTELVHIGEECARHGVKAIQLVGWNDGGQDQGNPSHDPDPRLGTFAELKQAIADIQALGVKLILFAKFTWADRATERFRNELVRYAVKDPYGDYYHYMGYQYQTATQLLDINTKRLIPMCFQSEDYLRVCDEEFRKTVELGADGILFDECLHHSPTLLCFDPDHGHRHGAPTYANDRKLIENFSKIALPVRGDFLFAGEACYDWEMEAYHLSYHRSESLEHIPLSRYMLPHAPFMTAVTGFEDRSMVNQCLLYRYIISYEPYNFKGRLDDYPATMAYGKQMDALRTELRRYFWDGEFRHEVGARVTVKGQGHHPYAVFRAEDGRRRSPSPTTATTPPSPPRPSSTAASPSPATASSTTPPGARSRRASSSPRAAPPSSSSRALRIAPLPGRPPSSRKGYDLTLSPSHRLTTPPPRAFAHSQLDRALAMLYCTTRFLFPRAGRPRARR